MIKELMEKHIINFQGDKFDKIENTLEDIKNEKIGLVEKILEKDMILDTVLNKSNNLKQHVFNIKKNFDKKLNKSNTNKNYFYGVVLLFLVVSLIYIYIYWYN